MLFQLCRLSLAESVQHVSCTQDPPCRLWYNTIHNHNHYNSHNKHVTDGSTSVTGRQAMGLACSVYCHQGSSESDRRLFASVVRLLLPLYVCM